MGLESKTTTTRRKKSRTKRTVNIDKLAQEYFNELYSYLGLDTIGIPRELAYKIVHEVLDMLYGGLSSKPKLDAVLKKIKRFKEKINSIIALRLLENVKDPTPEQLEFIIQNGGQLIISEISRLYELARKAGREDLISYLEYVWEKYGRPSPVRCPKCGFRAVMPDFTCYICGHVVNEEYVRRELGFDEKFKMYVEQASVAELRDVVELGYVLLGEDGVKSPRYRHKLSFEKKYFYPIYLKRRDVNLILEEILKRKIEI